MGTDANLSKLAKVIVLLQTELNNPEMQAQTMLTLINVMRQGELAMAELEKSVGVSQAAISRNISRLSDGLPPDFKGPHVVEAYEDPMYRRRKIVKLTPKGDRLRKKLVEMMEGRHV